MNVYVIPVYHLYLERLRFNGGKTFYFIYSDDFWKVSFIHSFIWICFYVYIFILLSSRVFLAVSHLPIERISFF